MLVLGTTEHLELGLFLQNWPFVLHFNSWVQKVRLLKFSLLLFQSGKCIYKCPFQHVRGMSALKSGLFLDTQVSLAPTHVSWLARWSHFRISNLWSPFCATVVFDDPPAMLLGSPPSPRRSTPSPRRSTPSPRRSTPSTRRSTPSPRRIFGKISDFRKNFRISMKFQNFNEI